MQDVTQSEEEKIWAENSAPKMDSLIGLAESLAFNEALPEDIRSEIKLILETRKTNRWADAEADNAKAKEAQAQAMQKAAPKKSSAIRIEVRNRNLFYFVTQRSNWDHNITLGGCNSFALPTEGVQLPIAIASINLFRKCYIVFCYLNTREQKFT